MKMIYMKDGSGRKIVVEVADSVFEADRETRRAIWRSDAKEKYHSVLFSKLSLGESGYCAGPGTEERLFEREARAEELALLRAALRALSPDQRKLVKKIYFENVSLKDLAAQQSVSYQALQNRRRKVLRRLRKIMRERVAPEAGIL